MKVFILDDHQMVREALGELVELTPDLDLVGAAGTVEQAITGIIATQADVAVLDARLGQGSGMDVCRYLRTHQPGTRCLLLTSHADQDAALAHLLAGAAGHTVKQGTGDELVHLIRQVAQGLGRHPDAAPLAVHLAALTRRRHTDLSVLERRILDRAFNGDDNNQIATGLRLTETEVRRHLSSLFYKLGLGGPAPLTASSAHHATAAGQSRFSRLPAVR